MVRTVTAIAALMIPFSWTVASELVPVKEETKALAPEYVHFMTRGAPADSFALRVSLCHGGSLWGEGTSSIFVEEVVWPQPVPGFDFNEETKSFTPQVFGYDQWYRGAIRINGTYLIEKARSLPSREVVTGDGVRMRAGELYVRCAERPFEFGGWLSPKEFAIEYDDVRFVIRWRGTKSYELVEYARIE